MKTLLRSLLVAAVLVSFSACRSKDSATEGGGGAAKDLAGKVSALGSSTAIQLAGPLAEAFRKQNPQIEVVPESSNSNWGLGALRQGMVDIALTTKPPEKEDVKLVPHAVARDGLCIIVHKSNPVSALSDEQLKGIFQGTIKSWKEVGGNDATIDRVNHAEVRTSLAMFVQYLGILVSDMKYSEGVISEDGGGIKTVANQPNAITYMSIASALNGIAEGKEIKMIGLRGVAPTVENVANGTVPVVYDVNFVTKDEPTARTKAFVDFATSSAAVEIVKAANFAPKK